MSNARHVLSLARHEYRAALRSRILVVLLVILVIVTAASVYIATAGYASKLADYDAYRAAAQASGLDRIAPSPLAPLSLLRGGLEYLEIIGAVIAIALGYLSISRERANRTLALLQSRPVTAGDRALGSFLGALAVFATLVTATALVGVLSIGLIAHDWISPSEGFQLLLAYLAALLYLGAFYCLGAIATARARSSANGLVVALGIWLLVVLVLPQIGDTLDADNQLPGGLFQALTLDRDGETSVMAHFTGYEKTRTLIEDTSFAKHFERFAFAMTDVKDRYRPFTLGQLLRETRTDIIWLLSATVALFLGLRRTYKHTPSTGGTS
ncbi:ABC transporter permease subunit [Nocardioides psychrotolerans]|uniref:ABC transporter permease n=1 Tax=Nocardioides psychrotolerans TaxID=1005945 RepID=UPI0031382D43